jgi:hypothetical protein
MKRKLRGLVGVGIMHAVNYVYRVYIKLGSQSRTRL